MPRVMLVQSGARHNFALGHFLHDHDMLQRLYTDFAIGAGDPLRALLHLPLPKAVRDKLLRRNASPLPAALIRSRMNLSLPVLGSIAARRPSARDIAESDAMYLQYFEGGADLRRRAPRTPIISDVFIIPTAYREVNREAETYPDWGEAPVTEEAGRQYDAYARTMFEQSDFLFCPSQAVIDDVAGYDPRHAAKCRLVPYGASLRSVSGSNPEVGRVLFCGSLHLRKGVHHIRAAAALLEQSHPHIRFVLAGSATPTMREKLTAPNIDLLGHLGKDALAREFGRADLFLFPSLAEGAAGAVLEAMASTVPVVATRAGGVDFSDGVSGIVIPPRDPEAIAAAVLRIVEDRPFRARLSEGAAAESQAYSMPAWEKRFIAAVRDVV